MFQAVGSTFGSETARDIAIAIDQRILTSKYSNLYEEKMIVNGEL